LIRGHNQKVAAGSAPVTVDFSTANGTANLLCDCVAAGGTVSFAPGDPAKTVTAQVNGDTPVEPTETFTVNLANATRNATIADGHAVGKIVNHDQEPAGHFRRRRHTAKTCPFRSGSRCPVRLMPR
jgi:Calx-beta domain